MNKVDKKYIEFFTGRMRAGLHRAERSLNARRNGVVTFFTAYESDVALNAIQVKANNTRPDKISVARTFQVGPRGGLFLCRPNYRRYFKAAQFGKGTL